MTATEEEMRKKWCPHYTPDHGLYASACFGSTCSQWRWFDPPPQNRIGDDPKLRRGYCGLAGRPINFD